MDALKDWIMTIAAVVITLGMVDLIVPAGRTKKTVRIVSGFILTAVLISPMFDFMGNISLENFIDFEKYDIQDQRAQIVDNKHLYNEEQLILISNSYKDKLSEYIIKKAEVIDGVKEAECVVVINEDYTNEQYGSIEQVYLSIVKGDSESKDENKGLGQVKRIEDIEINLDGIRVSRSNDEVPSDEENAELVKKIVNTVALDLNTDEQNIFVEIKE